MKTLKAWGYRYQSDPWRLSESSEKLKESAEEWSQSSYGIEQVSLPRDDSAEGRTMPSNDITW